MKEILKMIILKEEEFIIIIMEIYMKENLKMMNLMEKVFFIIMMEQEKWEIIKKESLQVNILNYMKMGKQNLLNANIYKALL